MLRTKLAKKVLTKKEQRHLTESGINMIDKMKRQVVFMSLNPDDVCFECKRIADKLGIKLEEILK